MNLLTALPNLLTRLTGNGSTPSVTITFTPQLPADVRNQIASQGANSPFTLTVSGASGNRLTFTAANGQTFQATVQPPLPVGTQLQLSAAELLPTAAQGSPQTLHAKILSLPQPSTGQATASTTTQVQQSVAVATSPQPYATPAQPSVPVLSLAAEATTPQALQTALTTALLQQKPVSQPTSPVPLSPVPAGPVAASLPTPFPSAYVAQPLVLTPTGPLKADGTQAATLSLQIPQPALPQAGTSPTPRSVSVTLQLGVALSPNHPQPAVMFPPATQQPAFANPSFPAQPVLFLTGNSASVPLTLTTPVTLPLVVPQPLTESPSLSPQSLSVPTLSPAPLAARILPPSPNQPAGEYTALLATGATLTLKSPQPLPTGSLVIVTDIPINPTAAVQRVLASEGQTQQQPNTTLQGNQTPHTAAPVATQTQQAVLAPGMVVQGTITGQNEQGQPLLTLTTPPQMAGQQAALNLTNPTALLPVGAGLTIRVDNSLAATILGLTLPAQTQAAYTVGTIGARWEGLQQGLHVLQQQAPVQAANLRASLPQLSNLMPGLLAFTNALRTNDPEKAFDREASRILKAMGIDLTSDISQLAQLQQRPAPHTENQWRGTLFPYVEAAGEDPRQGGFFWRREKSDNPRASTNTRFIVEVDMSQMGAMQLDGLVTYPDIWLKLRRTTPPEEGFTENLQTLVTQLLQAYGLGGGITVEATRTFPVNPRAELLAETENPLPTTA